jgi:predicted dehydrogenase
MDRRKFIKATGAAAAGSLLISPLSAFSAANGGEKMKIVLVGVGIRGITMWGKTVKEEYSDYAEFVGICDTNPGRLEHAKKYIGVDVPTSTDFDQLMNEVDANTVIVTTVDSTHHEYIIKGLQYGCNVITEKPMTTDEEKAQDILDAERRSGKKVTVTFNYRYSPHRAEIYKLLRDGAIGTITSVDFHWYLDVYHGADYFRRWHRLRQRGGTLLVHKSTHHFDLLNWWLESEPKQVFGYGGLEHYGRNGEFRSTNCRACPHKEQCKFYWDITKNDLYMDLYAANEKYDGYHRDGCVFRNDVNIFDKMAVQIKYANDVQVSYSLTTYSPYEGYRIAFNGTKGRLEAWVKERQPWEAEDYDELRLTTNFDKTELIKVPHAGGGHGGGDVRLMDKVFKDPNMADPLNQSAGSRDGAMSILTGTAARKSIYSGQPVDIASLTDLVPRPNKLIY